MPPLRPDARGLVALSTFATVAFVAPPAAPTPNAMCVQMPQVPAAPSCDWQKQMRNESAPTRRSGIWCGLVRLRFWLTYAMAHLRHPMAMRRQLRSFSLARHSRRRFCLEKLPCQPLPRMRCAACFLPHSAVLPHVSSSLSAYHNAMKDRIECIFPGMRCLPRTLDSRRSLDAHASPAAAGCPSCLAQTYASSILRPCALLATTSDCTRGKDSVA